jgi:hypothetical protein
MCRLSFFWVLFKKGKLVDGTDHLFLGFPKFCSVLLSLNYSAQVRGLVSVLEKFDNFFKACSVCSVDHTSD